MTSSSGPKGPLAPRIWTTPAALTAILRGEVDATTLPVSRYCSPTHTVALVLYAEHRAAIAERDALHDGKIDGVRRIVDQISADITASMERDRPGHEAHQAALAAKAEAA